MEKIIMKIKKYKMYLLCILVLVLSLSSIIIQSLDRKSTMKINNSSIAKQPDKIGVYISGAVKNPGIYYLETGARLCDLLDICGGVLGNADLDKLNPAKKLVDSDKITVPIKQEIVPEQQGGQEEQEQEQDTEKININTAGKEELKTLEGIGDVTADNIISYRKTKQFLEIEDIMNVGGIGNSKFEKIKNNICID